jgi:hypothetical protein
MTKRNIQTIISAMTTLMLVAGSAANAKVYDYTFTSPSETIIGQFTVDLSDDKVTDVTGTLSGAVDNTITGFVANPSFPNAAYSPDGAFIYNDLFHPGQNPDFDVYGVLFTTAGNPGGYWNLWGAGPGAYSLYESSPGLGYPIAINGGSLDLVAVPESSTWAMMLIGLVGVGSLACRGRKMSRLAPTFA